MVYTIMYSWGRHHLIRPSTEPTKHPLGLGARPSRAQDRARLRLTLTKQSIFTKPLSI